MHGREGEAAAAGSGGEAKKRWGSRLLHGSRRDFRVVSWKTINKGVLGVIKESGSIQSLLGTGLSDSLSVTQSFASFFLSAFFRLLAAKNINCVHSIYLLSGKIRSSLLLIPPSCFLLLFLLFCVLFRLRRGKN